MCAQSPADPANWPSGHLGWAFADTSELEGRAMRFFAAGAGQGEQLVFVADDPQPRQWPTSLLTSGQLVLASTRDLYGEQHLVVAARQRAAFEEVVADALDDGFTGVRILADNTSLIAGPERLAAWIEWEEVADSFFSENPVTGLCGFDRSRIDEATLARLLAVHGQTVSSP